MNVLAIDSLDTNNIEQKVFRNKRGFLVAAWSEHAFAVPSCSDISFRIVTDGRRDIFCLAFVAKFDGGWLVRRVRGGVYGAAKKSVACCSTR